MTSATVSAVIPEDRTIAPVQMDSRATARPVLKSTNALKELTIVTSKRTVLTQKEASFALVKKDSLDPDRLALMKMSAGIPPSVPVSNLLFPPVLTGF